MGNHGRLQLAIAVILASTRAAVESHRRARECTLVRATAERGLALIDELGARLPDDVPAEIRRLHAAARTELVGLAGIDE